jgi:hypothetical protein
MKRSHRIAEGVHLLCLGLWLGALVMLAAGAPMVFRVLREQDPALPGFASFQGPHYLIAGGKIVERLFSVCDMLQSIAAIGAVVTLAVACRRLRGRRAVSLVRLGVLVAVFAVLGYRFFLLDPGLTGTLYDYWAAAARGDNEAASRLRAVYDAGHAFQRKLFAAIAMGVLALVILGIISVSRRDVIEAK